MIKKNPTYRVTVYNQQDTRVIEYPLTCKFNSQRGTFSKSNKCTIDLYNLAPDTRAAIFKDALTLDQASWKYIKLEAGWNGQLSQIFEGRILQANSTKGGGQVDVITHIECQPFDIFSTNSSYTFEAGTSYKQAFKTISEDFPNVKLENLGNLEGTFKTQTTLDGNTLDCLMELTDGNTYVDNGTLNCILNNEVIDVPVPLVTDENGLLETPVRRDKSLTIKMLFEPTLIVGQLLEIKSSIAPQYNGQYKVLGFTHDCLISATQAGQRITTVDLWIAPLLTATNINISGEEVTGGASPVVGYNKVKKETVTPGDEELPINIRGVYNYIQKNNKAPHTQITNNIWWDEVIKPKPLEYGKPSMEVLTNLYFTATKIQAFRDKYYPGTKITINSGWRPRAYNDTIGEWKIVNGKRVFVRKSDPNSEHIYGNAIDFIIIGYTTKQVSVNFKNFWKGRWYFEYGFIHADNTKSRGIRADW